MLLSPGSTGMATSLWSWGGGPAWPLIAWHPLLPPLPLPVPPRLLWDVGPSTVCNGKWTSVSSGTRPCTYSLPPPPILLLSMTLNSQRADYPICLTPNLLCGSDIIGFSCCSVVKSSPTLCDPMDSSTPGPRPPLFPGVFSNSCPLSQ